MPQSAFVTATLVAPSLAASCASAWVTQVRMGLGLLARRDGAQGIDRSEEHRVMVTVRMEAKMISSREKTSDSGPPERATDLILAGAPEDREVQDAAGVGLGCALGRRVGAVEVVGGDGLGAH